MQTLIFKKLNSINNSKNIFKVHIEKSSNILCKNIKIEIYKRPMLSRGSKLANNFIYTPNCNALNVRNMVAYTGQTVKTNNPSPVLKKLNPENAAGSYHKNIMQTTCDNKDCVTKICPQPCTNNITQEIIGHLSSKDYLPMEEKKEKCAVLLSPINYKGEGKSQYGIIYKDSYKPQKGEFKEYKDATAFLNKNIKSPKDLNDETKD